MEKIFSLTLDTTQRKMDNNNVNYLATSVLLLVSIAMWHRRVFRFSLGGGGEGR